MDILTTQIPEEEKRNDPPIKFEFGKFSLERVGYINGIPIYKVGKYMRFKRALYFMFACNVFEKYGKPFYINFREDEDYRIYINKKNWRKFLR